jgi:hypothetical protein
MKENNGSSNSSEIENEVNPFIEINGEKLTRKELEKIPNKDLAKMVKDRALSRFNESTLSRKSKTYNIDLLLGVRDEEEKPQARATQTQSESDMMIEFALNTLQGIKQSRESQESVLNPIAKELFKSSAVAKVDEARANESFSTDKFNNILMYGAGAFLLIDSLVGIKNIPSVFSKLKNKMAKKKNDTK